MRSIVKYISVIILNLLLNSLSAQILDPVSWEFRHEKISDNEVDLIFKATIENQWHLYSQDLPEGGPIPTSFSFDESTAYKREGSVEEISKVEVKYDPSFNMDLKMYSREAIFKQKIIIESTEDFILSGRLEYMSCDDVRCLPPKEKEFSFPLAGLIVVAEPSQPEADDKIKRADQALDIEPTETEQEITSEDQEIIRNDEPLNTNSRSLWIFFLVSFLAGLAAILTPCVFPMIPMTVTFFMRGSENKAKAIMKGLVFGISIIAIYTSLGFIVSLTSVGADFANQISSHWIPNLIFFLLFMVFAASFLGMFELVLPASWVNRADRQADRRGYLGAFFMGLTTVLVSFSCTGPIVGALLVESAGGLALQPILGMFGFSVAFALPFTLFAIFPSWLSSLPQSGGWLNSVKVVLGFIVLAFGFKFLSTIDQVYHFGLLSRQVYLSIWIVIFTLLGFYLLGKLKLAHDSDLPYISVPRLVLSIVTFAFVVYMIPGLFGAPLNGISGLIPPKTSQTFNFTTTERSPLYSQQESSAGNTLCGPAKYTDFLHLPNGLEGYFDYEEGLDCAKQLNKPILLDFKGHSCSNCKEMEGKVWSNPEVFKRLRDEYVIVALYTDDRTKLPEEEWIISTFDGKVKKTIGKKNLDFEITHFNTNTQPLYVLIDHEGHPLTNPMGHDLNVERFISFLDRGIEKFMKTR